METFSIEQVARRSGTGMEMVRFYEREGLLKELPHRASGYPQYSERIVTCLHFVKRVQQLGFSLNEISELLLVDAQTSWDARLRLDAPENQIELHIYQMHDVELGTSHSFIT